LEANTVVKKLAGIFLWISIIAWGLWFGALVYEMNVVMPLWSSHLPQSAIEWNSRPGFRFNPTPYYVPVAITTILSSLVALLLGWRAGGRTPWLLISSVSSAVTLAYTLLYFFQKNEVLFRGENIGLGGDEITSIANAWIAGNWVRVVIMAVGYYAALRAFRLGAKERE
jgi:hypothetical protein